MARLNRVFSFNNSAYKLYSACGQLKQYSDGIWRSKYDEKVFYPPEGNEACFKVEDHSFWFRHRNACIAEMVRNFPPQGSGPIFDIGGGNGFVAKGLMDAGWDVVLIEPRLAGAKNARSRGISNVICATTESAKFPPGTIPAIGVFDTVEHIKDDLDFLRHLWDLLIPGGRFYLTVPAFHFLWSHEDVEAGHFRRYTLRQIKEKLSMAGFEVSYSTYIFQCLVFAVGMFRALPFQLGFCKVKRDIFEQARRDHLLKEGLSSKVISKILAAELRKIKKQRVLAFGASCMVAARKNKSKRKK